MMTELGFVERPILNWLRLLGWTYRTEKEMQAFERPLSDPLVEKVLLPAICRINPSVTSTDQARLAVDRLRQAMLLPDPLAANRETLAALRDGVSVVIRPGEPATTVYFIEFDPACQDRNEFTATNQYTVRGTEEIRADTALLVNGIPLVVAEFKSYLSAGKDWKEGVRQLHRYQREAPAVLTPSVFAVAADEEEFRYGPIAYRAETDELVRMQMDHWQPWFSRYPEQRGYWNLPEEEKDTDRVRAAVNGLLRPSTVLDFLQHFVVFETKKGRTVKKVARYQQFEAANDIVDRTIGLVGVPAVTSQDRTGLIWHTQGSGKSLTMIYAGYKLRRHPRLGNPTVLVVVDRSDLKTQLGDEFEHCDYPNVAKALGVEDLKKRIRGDARETIVTTVQCFQRMGNLEPNTRDNTILLIDECHRSQKGGGRKQMPGETRDAASFAMTMRVKLPNAFRFGFTGTPIDRTMVNTHRDFGPEKEGKQERYLSYYGIRQAIRDGATLPVHYLLRHVPLAVAQQPLNIGYEQMCEEMEVEDEEAKDFVQKKETAWKKLAKDAARMRKVAGHVVDHFLAYPDPGGFKAQFVAVDRDACADYKTLLDEELIRRGYSKRAAEAFSDVIISETQNDLPKLETYHYDKEKTESRIDYFKLTPAQWEARNCELYGDDRERWDPPLKILIVCDKLLAGFDAPVEQLMYLDKPLRDHNLLQAMARTNRPFPEMRKAFGLIVDLFGVFKDLEKALNFDEKEIEDAAIDWEKLKEALPGEISQCMGYFTGCTIADTRDSLNECLLRLKDEKVARQFKEDFLRLETLWEALSPDPCLYPHQRHYAFLCSMYVAYLRRNRRQQATYEELAVKTQKLIREHTQFMDIAEDVPVYVIDADYVTKTRQLPTAADRAAELEKALTKELLEGGGGFAYRLLGQRLADIISQKTADISSMVKDLEELAGRVNALKSEPERLHLTGPAEYPLFTVMRGFVPEGTAESKLVKAAKGIAAILARQRCLTKGWAESAGARKKLATTLMTATWEADWEDLNFCPPEVDDPPFLKEALEELAKAGC